MTQKNGQTDRRTDGRTQIFVPIGVKFSDITLRDKKTKL
jgi:hypothetical protein